MQIKREDFIRRINNRELPAVTLCYGEESFFHQEILDQLRKIFCDKDSWGFEVIDAVSFDSAKLAASAGTLSFGGGTKVTIIRNAHKLTKGQLSALEKVAFHSAKERAVVLLAEKEFKVRDSIISWAKANKLAVCHFTSLKPREITTWLSNQASLKGFNLDSETSGFMIDLSANNLMALSQMLSKIDLFRGDKDRITLKDVEDLLHDSFEKGVYDCVRFYLSSRIGTREEKGRMRQKAASEYHRVLRFNKKDGIIQLIWALSREAFSLLKYHDLAGKISTEDLARELRLGARKWLLNKEYPSRAKVWSQERLHRLLIRLADVDLAIRTTGRDPESMLEQVIIGNLAPTSIEEYDEVFLQRD